MRIGLVVYPGCMASGLLAFAELLGAANQRSGKVHFDVVWTGVNDKPVNLQITRYGASVSVVPTMPMTDDSLEALLIPGFWTDGEGDLSGLLENYGKLISTLKGLASSTQLWAYCSAVSLLAEADLLKNKKATSTWWLTDFLSARSPDALWRFSQTFVADGNIMTASGVNGHLPIAESIIEQKLGHTLLRDIIELMVVPKPEHKVTPLRTVNMMQFEEPLIRQIYAWVEETAASHLNIAALAQALHTTERTLARKVKAMTGLSCAQFMRLVKVKQASDYLIYSSQSISQLSDRLGFTDDTSFRRTFKSTTGYTPSDYRTHFGRLTHTSSNLVDST